MAFPDLQQTVDLLGRRAKDKVTGLEGVVTTVNFDLYGCVQVSLHPGLGKDGKVLEQHWYDVSRLTLLGTSRAMEPPLVGTDAPLAYGFGSSNKPSPRSV